jgi:ribonuclease J
MLAAAAEVAREAGVSAENAPLLDNGDRLSLSPGGMRVERAAVASGKVFLDSRPETVDVAVVRDRRQLAEEGFVVLFIPSDPKSSEIGVVARGVAAPEAGLASEVGRAVRAVLARATPEERGDVDWLRAEIALSARRACRRAFGVRPVIVPVVA